MKKVLLSIAATALCASATAQYVIVNNELPILASDVEKITYEEDEQFKDSLLPSVLAADPKTQLFSNALQLTGLAEMLSDYYYPNYQPIKLSYHYAAHVWKEVAIFNSVRFKNFTMFVETDNTLAAKGITNIDQLKAYAKQVYDEVFPEDAGVTDPKDRRNSLNRFVAYHILPHGSTYWYLTFYDGKVTDKFVDTNLTDINCWYGTLMPHASLKCSYPMGTDRGIFLNHRGLKDGPDKYGIQVRGAKVLPANDDPDDPFTQRAFNGYYFYIDDVLTYDKTTREDVLGSELWRVDFKTLSPDIMNNAVELRGTLQDDVSNVADESGRNGRNYAYEWDCMENIIGENTNTQLVARRAHPGFWSWQGDEINVFGESGSFTIKLPPLPAGEWEIRMGISSAPTRPSMKVYLNGQVTIDSLVMTPDNQNAMKGPRECWTFTLIGDYGMSFDNANEIVRFPLGRITTDGKSDNYLKLEYLPNGRSGNNYELMLDYFEFVPKSLWDKE